MNPLKFLDLTINFTHQWEDGSNHLVKVHMELLEAPSLSSMYHVVVVEDKRWMREFWHVGVPDVETARQFARYGLDNPSKDAD